MTDMQLTTDDWARAGAPLDHAPGDAVYVRHDGVWRTVHASSTQAEMTRLGVDLRCDFVVSMWCEHVAKFVSAQSKMTS